MDVVRQFLLTYSSTREILCVRRKLCIEISKNGRGAHRSRAGFGEVLLLYVLVHLKVPGDTRNRDKSGTCRTHVYVKRSNIMRLKADNVIYHSLDIRSRRASSSNAF